MTSIKAIAWDIDGTLIDSEPLHEKVLISTCDAYGVDLSDLPRDHFLGVHLPDVWLALEPRLAGRTTREAWLKRLVEAYVTRSGELVAFADVIGVMRMLAQQGIRQVCVSNSGRAIVDANLAAIGADAFLEFSISLDDVVQGKPDPEPYLRAAARLGLAPAEIAAVEDSPTGARAAHLAGLRVFGIAAPGVSIPLAEATVPTRNDLMSFFIPAPAGSRASPRSSVHGL